MALRHYLGRDAKPAEPPWDCPTCGAENTVPLKAGCQKCGAGADAKKVGVPETPAAEPLPPLHPAGVLFPPAVAVRLPQIDAVKAALDWMVAQDYQVDSVLAWANSEQIQEAFMAGVAWAQAQQQAHPVTLGVDWAAPEGERTVTVGNLPPEFLWIGDGVGRAERPDVPTLTTILAALAFYRDNHLNYGAIPGQLSAQQVTELITRLSPAEQP